jgi:hypothetical protein
MDLSSLSPEQLDSLKRKAVLVPCKSKDALKNWVSLYLNLDLPNCIVDPGSNSCPMDILWLAYCKMVEGDPDYTRILFFAARDCFKSLLASVIELLSVLHLKRDNCHLAAIESQSRVCARYLRKYAVLSYIRDYVSQMSERRIEFTRFERSGETISFVEYNALNPVDKLTYTQVTNFIQVVIATMQGTNSAHSQVLLLDELDLAPRAPVEESKMIPTQCADGKPPVVLMTSSRKFAAGLVQEEIDEAEERGTRVFHWNLLDCTRPCPPERHLPQSPMIDIYYSESNLKAISEVAWGELGEDQKEKYKKTTGYTGCLKNCRLFAVCRGRLVSGQKCKSPLLKTIPHVQNLFRSVDVEVAKAQLMCWKPSNYGLIYPNFDASLHVLTAAQIATKVTGDNYPASFSKADLIRLFKSRDAQFFAGMDHGYTHNFAVVAGAKDGNRFFVLDVISAAELELSQKIEVCTSRIKDLNPVIYADPEDPASNKTLKKHFRMRDWSKKPGSVVGGISIVRYKLMPTMGNEPQLYFLGGDSDVETLVKDFSKYRWMLDKNSGKPTDIPSEEDDDRMDALRYVIMNVFDKSGKLMAAPETASEKRSLEAISGGGSLQQGNYSQSNWASKIIQECLQPTSTPGQDDANQSQSSKGKKGGFIWDLG